VNEETGDGRPERHGDEESPRDAERIKDEETVGEVLLSSREKRGLTLESVSLETKIPVKMLQYLETDNFEALPAKVYVKGFLRSYAGVLDLDVEYILDKYEVQTGQTHRSKGDLWEIEADVVEEQLKPPRIFKRFALPVIIAAALVIFLSRIDWRREPAVEPPPPLIEMTEEEIGTVVEDTTDENDTPASEEPTPHSEDARPPSEDKTPTDAVESDVRRAVNGIMELSLTAYPSDSSWIDLLTVSMVEEVPETTTYRFLLLPGRRRSFEAGHAFIFRMIGNAGGVSAEIDGRKLPPFGERGRVRKGVTITRDDLRER
jgi:cytoskeletal protein RodZ